MPVIRTVNAVPDDVLMTGIHCIQNYTEKEIHDENNKVEKIQNYLEKVWIVYHGVEKVEKYWSE